MAIETTSKILALAAAAGGVCTRCGLVAAGVSTSAIDRRIRTGDLVVIRAGVYEVPVLAGPMTALYRATGAVPDSVISRPSAAVEHEFVMFAVAAARHRIGPVHITAPHGAGRTVPGVIVHETRLMHDDDTVQLAPGLLATSPARTIVDLAAGLSMRRLRHLVQVQVQIGCPTAIEIHACFSALRRRGLPGTKRLDRVLVELFAADPIVESELESRVRHALNENGVTGFQPQFSPPWYDGRRGIVDFAHRDLRIVLEADGRRWHSTTQSMAEDHRRDRLAAAHGWVTIRVGWSEIVDRPAATMAEIVAVMKHRGNTIVEQAA